MTAFRFLALLPALALAVPAMAQVEPVDDRVVILFGAEGLYDPDPLPTPVAPDDGVVDFGRPTVFEFPEIAVPAAPGTPSAPADTVDTVALPEGWVVHEEYGLRFALPPEFDEIQRDEDDAEIFLVLGTLDIQARAGIAYSLGFVPQRDLASFAEDVGEEFGLGTLEPVSEAAIVGGLRWSEYEAATDAADLGGVNASVAMRVLIGDEQNAYGMFPVIMMLYFSVEREEQMQTERGFLGSIEVVGTLGAPTPEVFRDGAVSYQVPPGARRSGGYSETEGRVRYVEGSVDYARVLIAELGTRDWAVRSFLDSEYNGDVTVEESVFDGVPVWVLNGRPAFTFAGAQRTVEGDSWRARSVVTQVCPGEQGPIAVTAITTTDRIEAGLSLDGLLAPARFHLDAAPRCPETVFSAFAERMQPAAAPTDGRVGAPETPAEDPEPVVPAPAEPAFPDAPPTAQPPTMPDAAPQPGKPEASPPVVAEPDRPVIPTRPVQPTDPDAAAWARAETAQTAAAMLGYLAEWPRGTYAEQAREWLSMRAIVVPQDIPSDPEARAWAEAEAAQSVEAMLRYLSEWPNGAHSGAARDWLSARAIVVPETAPALSPESLPGK